MKLTKIKAFNFEGAIRGMRNPMNSWDKSDSKFINDSDFALGEKDLTLCKKLIKAGTEHRKFLRQIFVSMDIEACLSVWNQLDTYKFLDKNSCSRMHSLHKKKLTRKMFCKTETTLATNLWNELIPKLNEFLHVYNESGEKMCLRDLYKFLPPAFLQKRTVSTNYECLMNIYFQRKNHKLPEWQKFCNKLINTLPYFREFVNCIENK